MQHDYQLDGELRRKHTYLTADKQDFDTKKVICLLFQMKWKHVKTKIDARK